MSDNPLRELPAVHQVLADSSAIPLLAEHGRDAVIAAVRAALAEQRESLQRGERPADLWEMISARVERFAQPSLRRVINATGVILHTNLGRAPLAEAAAQAAYEAGCGYLNLELDLAAGLRAHRADAVRGWLCQILGCQSATAVNNCAAATVLVLRALAAGRDVIVSRGQLVEIGGSFRIPEIMATSGAVLREVGTTNITRIGDYEAAITAQTALLMRIHQSNFRTRGFVEAPGIAELVGLARQHGLPVVDDIGSGALVDFGQLGFPGEPLAAESIRAGADLVLFSGDKLMGGPQAGIIAGRSDLIQCIERDSLMRAVRLDKMTLAALEATLRLYLRPDTALAEVPILRLLQTPIDELRRRGNTLAEQIPGSSTYDGVTYVGGGSLPDQAFPTVVVAITSEVGEEELARRLRLGSPAVLPRLQSGRVLLDLRSVPAEQDVELISAARIALEAT